MDLPTVLKIDAITQISIQFLNLAAVRAVFLKFKLFLNRLISYSATFSQSLFAVGKLKNISLST